ncbi:RNA-binding protein S1, partial [Enterococcus faecalis]
EVFNRIVNDIHDVLSVGDEVSVYVTSVGVDGKIGLSIRKAQEPAEGHQPKREFHRREDNYENRDRIPRAGGKKPFNKPQA